MTSDKNKSEKEQSVLDSRYQLNDEIGKGAMGVVYKASDRLTGKPVAVKQVQLQPVAADDDSTTRRLQLAQEFQLLAGLRHPNVISVYDYGFDENKQPYFTMSLLEEPENLLDAAKKLDNKGKATLLVDMLQALAYLHQRGIIHRDLKPGNVLVDGSGTTHVLDFGLAINQATSGEIAGTLNYIAPEILDGESASEASDLYSVGVMAYEMYAGQHPFNVDDYEHLIQEIMYDAPDLSALDDLPLLKAVIERLLKKSADMRYLKAVNVIQALCEAMDLPLPSESAAIREGYLQSAKFVGRETEINALTEAYEEAASGNGSLWLIGGESGIGKSRLVDELRTQALIRGALVLRGQAVEGGGLPYQLWRDVLRRLVLMVELTDNEASVFKEIIPEIEILLNKSVPYPAVIPAEDSRRRFATTLVDILRRIPRPLVLLLEDLQWALDSIEPLRHFINIMPDIRVLVVATYRSDENPTLPQLIPGAKHMPLERLDNQAIAQLTSAMLGASGTRPQVLDLLQRETEGNTFFIVEVVRALAESAGRLSEIGHATIPSHIFSGGIQEVMKQRVERVPQRHRGLLRLAAVVGRIIDVELLEHLAEKYAIHIEDWLMEGVNAAVLEYRDSAYRFTHDKLRQYLIDDIPAMEKPIFHQQVAEAIEWIHLGDMNYAAQLQHHWEIARRPDKERYYAATAAGQNLAMGDHQKARHLFARVLELTPEDEAATRGTMLLTLTDVTLQLNDTLAAHDYAVQVVETAKQAKRPEMQLEGLLAQARISAIQMDILSRLSILETAILLFDTVNTPHLQIRLLNAYGTALIDANRPQDAQRHLDKAMTMAQEQNERALTADCYMALGLLVQAQGDDDDAQMQWYDALMLYESVASYANAAATRGKLGELALKQERYAVAAAHLELSLRTERDLDNQRAIAERLVQLGYVYLNLADESVAISQFKEALQIALEIDSPPLIVQGLLGLAEVQIRQESPYFAAEFLGLAQVTVKKVPSMQAQIDVALDKVGKVLDKDTVDEALRNGQTLDTLALLATISL